MVRPSGVHHLAISTADIKGQIAFFSDVLAMELVAFYPMHGADNATHAFLKANDHTYVAFVTMPCIEHIPVEIGKTHAGYGAAPSSPGTMQHLALNVDSDADLLAMRDRIREKGVSVFGPINHGFCKSIYFAGPENLTLEVSTSPAPIDGRAWIDPAVAAAAGVSPEELERFRNPAPIRAAETPVPQPAYDPGKPHMVLPEQQYEGMLAMSDAEFAAMLDDPTPPVQLPEYN